MNATTPTPRVEGPPAAGTWTCPFCPLLCDDLQPDAASLGLPDSACPRAREGLSAVTTAPSTRAARIDGREVPLEAAIAAAAQRLGAARQPLFAGLGGDVAAGRAAFRLAAAAGAICDAVGGDALMQGLRVQQDRGGFNLTLAEVRERADLVLFVGSWPEPRAPRLLERFSAHRETPPALVALGTEPLAEGVECVLPEAPLADSLAMLSALVGKRRLERPHPELQVLAERLLAARYAVLVWEPGQLGAHGALAIEWIQRIVVALNQRTRAAGFPLGGAHGAATANQAFTWLGGLPLRSRFARQRIDHQPQRYGTGRLVARDEVDLVLWANPFPAVEPLATRLPRIVLAAPAAAATLGDETDTVFMPVATPGVHHRGHLFRTDGVVLMPLFALRDDGLPTLAALLGRLADAMEGGA
ncbi:MAG: formylmethanofuran dehydrogenase [Rhodocyclaceae bacterium]|nr:formylmethanofuran dehydrogenase [Rhodocyclaceae bacterium]